MTSPETELRSQAELERPEPRWHLHLVGTARGDWALETISAEECRATGSWLRAAGCGGQGASPRHPGQGLGKGGWRRTCRERRSSLDTGSRGVRSWDHGGDKQPHAKPLHKGRASTTRPHHTPACVCSLQSTAPWALRQPRAVGQPCAVQHLKKLRHETRSSEQHEEGVLGRDCAPDSKSAPPSATARTSGTSRGSTGVTWAHTWHRGRFWK